MDKNLLYVNLLYFFRRYETIISLYEGNKLDVSGPKIIELVATSYLKQGVNKKVDEYIFNAKVTLEKYFSIFTKRKSKLMKLYQKAKYLVENIISPQKRIELNAQLLEKRSVKNSKAWIILSSNYDVAKNPNLAINFLKNAIWINPKSIIAYYKLAYIYEKNLNKIDASIYYYKKAVLLNPEDDEYEGIRVNARYIQMACVQLANIMYKKKNFKAVMLLLEKALPLNSITGVSSRELIKDLFSKAVKASDKLGIKDKYLKKLYNKYKILPNNLDTFSFVL